MGELWRKRKWRQLLNLIRQLPSNSLYAEALWNDQELAESLPDFDGEKTPPRFSQWTPELGALANISDQLSAVINTLRVTIKNDPVKFPPYPRPKSAMQIAVMSRSRQLHESLVRRLTPKE